MHAHGHPQAQLADSDIIRVASPSHWPSHPLANWQAEQADLTPTSCSRQESPGGVP